MYLKIIPIKLVVTAIDNPCILVDGFIFIWTLINLRLYAGNIAKVLQRECTLRIDRRCRKTGEEVEEVERTK